MGTRDPQQARRKGGGAGWTHDQMPVVGHQDIGDDLERQGPERVTERLFEVFVGPAVNKQRSVGARPVVVDRVVGR